MFSDRMIGRGRSAEGERECVAPGGRGASTMAAFVCQLQDAALSGTHYRHYQGLFQSNER